MVIDDATHPSPKIRRVAHLDMDAFYASVELLRYPQLKGLPVVIGGGSRSAMDALRAGRDLKDMAPAEFPTLDSYVGRGVITTATYAARAFGVGSAMGIMKAAKLCPKAIMLPVDFDEYRRYSQAFKAVIADIAPVIENRGVDEVYIEFTEVAGGQRQGGKTLAKLIQKSIVDATGLTCSVGVAPNKLLAKMASELNKPNGISVVMADEIESKIWPLAVRKINGIGPKTDAKLAAQGILTIGDLAAQPLHELVARFGSTYGAWLFEAAWGRDDRPVVTESEPVSMSRETTFERDLHAVRDRAELGRVFTALCESVAKDLQRQGYVGRTIGVKLRTPDFKVSSRDHSIEGFTNDARTIRTAAGLALKRAPLSRPLRLLGVRVGKLMPEAAWRDAELGTNLASNQHSASVFKGFEATKKVANDTTLDLFDPPAD